MVVKSLKYLNNIFFYIMLFDVAIYLYHVARSAII